MALKFYQWISTFLSLWSIHFLWCKWLEDGERPLWTCQRERATGRRHSDSCPSTAITLTKTVCLFWLLACAQAVVSYSTVFNNRSTLPWEPLSLSSIQPLELLLSNSHAPLKRAAIYSIYTYTQKCISSSTHSRTHNLKHSKMDPYLWPGSCSH